MSGCAIEGNQFFRTKLHFGENREYRMKKVKKHKISLALG